VVVRHEAQSWIHRGGETCRNLRSILSPEQLRRLGLAADRIMSRIDTSEIS
jgi:hypothetical protein